MVMCTPGNIQNCQMNDCKICTQDAQGEHDLCPAHEQEFLYYSSYELAMALAREPSSNRVS